MFIEERVILWLCVSVKKKGLIVSKNLLCAWFFLLGNPNASVSCTLACFSLSVYRLYFLELVEVFRTFQK